VPRSVSLGVLGWLALTPHASAQGLMRRIGSIQSYATGSVITAPDTVRVAAPFLVTVNTFGSSSCTIPDGATITIAGLLATITPYDRVPREPTICTGDIAPRPHRVQVTFGVAGPATIRVQGYTINKGQRVLSSVDHAVVVQPSGCTA